MMSWKYRGKQKGYTSIHKVVSHIYENAIDQAIWEYKRWYI